MTIILFLVDTSSSMCQKAYVNGVQKSYLDIAKGAVETFLKIRQRTQDCLGDRYMLLTFEEPPANVKAGWKENHATFMNELKNLQSTGLTSMGESLKNAFDLLNLNRMQSGIDTYGQGRCPFYLEPSVIIVITDGGRYSFRNGVHQEIILPLNTQIPGTKFTKEPFRWDQRLFSLVLRMSGNRIDERVEGKAPHDDSPIERMCEVTGGRSYRVRSQYSLNQSIESLVQKVQPGVVLQFEPMLPKDNNGNGSGGNCAETVPDIAFQPTKKMIYVQKHISQKAFPIGYWPLPEPYWPDTKAVTLPPRDAHPKLKIVTPAVDEPQLVRNFPIDKYEIEVSPLTVQILQKSDMAKCCWQVIISNGMHGFELPFGYLKAAPKTSQVHLYVLAYNYPALLPLLHDLIHKYNMSPPNDLMYKFNAYVRSIPPYYSPFLRKALLNISVPYPLLQFLLPENVDNYLSPTIANQLKHIKNTAKQDQENLCLKVYKQLKQPKPPYRQLETAKLNAGVPLRRDLVRHPLLRDTFAKLHADIEPIENYTIVVPQMTRQASAKSYRNPFDIPRRDLIEEIARMRETFLRPSFAGLVAKDSGHCLPIAEMGNYQEYLKSKDNPLREIEPTNVRQHMFGNPYKKDKHMVMVDEADLSDVAAPMKAANNNGAGGHPPGVPVMIGVGGGPGPGPSPKKLDASRARKRKAGPIRKDFIFRRTSTDVRPHSSHTSGGGGGDAASPTPSVGTPIGGGGSGAALSDFDDDSASETGSLCSGMMMSDDGDSDRLVVSFDFNEDEPCSPLNGHVHNFINGTGDESSCDSDMSDVATAPPPALPASPLGLAAGSSALAGNVAFGAPVPSGSLAVAGLPGTHGGPPNGAATLMVNGNNGLTQAALHANVTVALPASAPYPYLAAYGGPASASGIGAALGEALTPSPPMYAPPPLQFNGNAYGSAVSPALPPAATTALPPAVAPSAHHQTHHNDINDAQEISRILQQCHNGNSNTASNSSSTSSSSSSSIANSPATIHGMAYGYEPLTAGDAIKLEADAATTALPQATTSSVAAHANAAALSSSFDNLKRESLLLPNSHNSCGSAIGAANQNYNNHQNSNNNGSSSSSSSSHQAARTQSASPQPLPPLSDEQRELARQHNLTIRAQVFRDIRRPGRNYTALLDHLNHVKGDLDMKAHFIQMCINESLRFRRRQMVSSIQDWWEQKQEQQAMSNQHGIGAVNNATTTATTS